MISINDFADYEFSHTIASNGSYTKLEMLIILAHQNKLTFRVKHKKDVWEFASLNKAIDVYNHYA